MTSKEKIAAAADKYNELRRERRRMCVEGDHAPFMRDVSLDEVREALRTAKESSWNILRLVALLDNLSAHHKRAVLSGGDSRARTSGVRGYLMQDEYLAKQYATLMHYRYLASDIRDAAGINHDANLLWGFETTPPDPDDIMEFESYAALRNLYTSLEGKNFKQIETTLQEIIKGKKK